ncbi:helix-turn-helix domain-containing protein [Streptomyces sp. NPDC050610]|uniref:helix-turn-helix transcriptional regulator n=1 Tax=Streptomyces sp. NPDC050610 TaxID=3157097 RepID=UPI0034484D7A
MSDSIHAAARTENWQLLAPPQLAELLAVSDKTLRNWRNGNKGPRYLKLDGGAVRYPMQDVYAWLDEQRSSTVHSHDYRVHEMRPAEPARYRRIA